jgi:hypothetical protein
MSQPLFVDVISPGSRVAFLLQRQHFASLPADSGRTHVKLDSGVILRMYPGTAALERVRHGVVLIPHRSGLIHAGRAINVDL